MTHCEYFLSSCMILRKVHILVACFFMKLVYQESDHKHNSQIPTHLVDYLNVFLSIYIYIYMCVCYFCEEICTLFNSVILILWGVLICMWAAMFRKLLQPSNRQT
jgi:hypothetical protein